MLTNLVVRRTMLALLVALLVMSVVAPAAFAQEETEITNTTEILVDAANDQAAQILQESVSETDVEIVNVVPEGTDISVIVNAVNVEQVDAQVAQIIQVNAPPTTVSVVATSIVVNVGDVNVGDVNVGDVNVDDVGDANIDLDF